jgi:DNA-binding NarL/FixJ family response regulator
MREIIRLAVVDDHKMMRQSLINSLNCFENLVVSYEAGNGRELLQKLSNANGLPHICLMDISMPVMNGYEATREVSRLFPKVKILAVTMFGDDFNILRMLSGGACGYMLKDNSIEELVKAIESVHQYGFYNSSTITNALKIMARANAEKSKSYVLNEKEVLFLSMCCTNMTYRQIARRLHISHNTISTLTDEIYRKISISTRLELAIFAMRVGITPYNDKEKV